MINDQERKQLEERKRELEKELKEIRSKLNEGKKKKKREKGGMEPIREAYQVELMKDYLRQNKTERDYYLFCIGMNIGLRISDLLKTRPVDFEGDFLRITEEKTGKFKAIPIPERCKQYVNEYVEKCQIKRFEYLFPSRKTKNGEQVPLKRVQAYNVIKEAGNHVGLKNVGSHTLRKSFGYWFYKETHDIATLMEIFNHDQQKTTLDYIGMNEEELKKKMSAYRGT